MTTSGALSKGISVKPRRMNFAQEESREKYWYKNNSIITTFFYSLSVTFPEGERTFIHSVRHYMDQIEDETLKKQVRGFIGQEAHHGIAHEKFNQSIVDMGVPVDKLESKFKKIMLKIRDKLSPPRLLAGTIAMEHMTAIWANFVLTHPHLLDDIDPHFRNMTIWHAIEELEHKAVAFDVYQHCVGDERMRLRVMMIITAIFMSRIFRYQLYLLWADKKIPSFREIGEAWTFFWGREGFFRKPLSDYKDYFREGFHPWDHDNRHLVKDWQSRYPEVAAAQES